MLLEDKQIHYFETLTVYMSMFFLESFQVAKPRDLDFHKLPILKKLLNTTKFSGNFDGFFDINEKNKIEMRYKKIIESILTVTILRGS